MLIESDRLRPGDLEAWQNQSAFDARMNKNPTYQRAKDHALQLVTEATQHDGYAGTTWGKDSMALTHMISQITPHYPIVWIRLDGLEMPDTLPTRDAFLRDHDINYHEISVDGASVRRWWHDDTHQGSKHGPDAGFKEAQRRWGKFHISGVRSAESTTRRLTTLRNGPISKHSARPLHHLTALHIWAYLTEYDLPIHPTYAMNLAGARDRDWLRVSTIGGTRGTGKGRAEWERAYYQDVIDQWT